MEGKGGVVDLELAHGDLKSLIVGGVDGVDPRENHGADFLEAGERLGAGLVLVSDGVADFDFGGGLHVCDDVADVPGFESVGFGHLGSEDAGLLNLVVGGSMEELDLIAFLDLAGDDANVGDDAAELIIERIENGGAKEAVGIFDRRRDEFDDGFKDILDPDPLFGGGGDGVIAGDGEDVFELLAAAGDIGGGKVDFVEDGEDGEVLLHGEVDVGHGLGFHALGGIDDEDGALASGEGPGDFVGKVNVAGGVEEVELVGLTVLGFEREGDGMGFDGDPFFPLEVHGVEVLGLGLPLGNGLGVLHEPIGQGRFAMIDMSDDGEITGEFDGHGKIVNGEK